MIRFRFGTYKLYLWLLICCVGCASRPLDQHIINYQSAKPLPAHIELTAVPFHPQEKFHCGPAALAMMLNHMNVDVHPDQLQSEVYVPKRRGSFQIEMVAAARSRGSLVYPLEGSMGQLLQEVSAGNPVLVLQNLSIPWWPVWHYAVVIGYDLQKQHIILRSGTKQRLVVGMGTFERTWKRAKNWGVVILPSNQLPATVTLEGILDVAFKLEVTGQLTAAQKVYTTILNRWPGNQTALLGMGNSLYQNGQYNTAARVFIRMINSETNNVPVGWNNLAYSLAAKRCWQQAIQAAECAQKLSPEEANFKHTLSEITASSKVSKQQQTCEVQLPDCGTEK